MSVKDYKNGIKDGAKIAQEKAENFERIFSEQADIKECITLIIDYISLSDRFDSLSDKEKQQAVAALKEKLKEMKKKSFSVDIITNNEEDKKIADNLRKTINKELKKCRALHCSYKDYIENSSNLTDYTVFIQNLEKYNEKEFTTIYSAFGCTIKRKNNTILAEYNMPDNMNLYRKKLVDYYLNLVDKEEQNQDIIKKFKKINPNVDFETDINSYFQKTEGKENLVSSVSVSSFSLNRLLLPILPLSPPVAVAGLLASILAPKVIGVSARAAKSLVKRARERDFDKNTVAEIQRQILQIKLFEFFKNEQLGLNADNFNLDTNTK